MTDKQNTPDPAPTPPRAKMRELAALQFGQGHDDEHEESCYWALEQLYLWLVQQGWSAPQPAPEPLSERDAFERAYAEMWHCETSPRKESIDDLQYEVSTWRDGESYPDDLPRLRFGWEWWKARAAVAAQGGQ